MSRAPYRRHSPSPPGRGGGDASIHDGRPGALTTRAESQDVAIAWALTRQTAKTSAGWCGAVGAGAQQSGSSHGSSGAEGAGDSGRLSSPRQPPQHIDPAAPAAAAGDGPASAAVRPANWQQQPSCVQINAARPSASMCSGYRIRRIVSARMPPVSSREASGVSRQPSRPPRPAPTLMRTAPPLASPLCDSSSPTRTCLLVAPTNHRHRHGVGAGAIASGRQGAVPPSPSNSQ